MKFCLKCKKEKQLIDFNKDKTRKDGAFPWCKVCTKKANEEQYHTKDGIVHSCYGDQKKSSKRRGDEPPNYTRLQLRDWCFRQPIFHELFDNWKASGFKKEMKPSCDRTDDYKGYCLSRLQLMTWQENNNKARADIKNGINNKGLRPVIKCDKEGSFIKQYYSISQAERETGVCCSNIFACCAGYKNYSHAGGYIWKYANCQTKRS